MMYLYTGYYIAVSDEQIRVHFLTLISTIGHCIEYMLQVRSKNGWCTS